jgi:hypothetical protein
MSLNWCFPRNGVRRTVAASAPAVVTIECRQVDAAAGVHVYLEGIRHRQFSHSRKLSGNFTGTGICKRFGRLLAYAAFSEPYQSVKYYLAFQDRLLANK